MYKLLNGFASLCVGTWQDMYDQLSRKIDLDSFTKSNPCLGEFATFSNTERTNHPSIIQVYITTRLLHTPLFTSRVLKFWTIPIINVILSVFIYIIYLVYLVIIVFQ